jgi:SAM-dependent methyltransferase
MMDNKERFSNRVDDYVKYRPSYPEEALRFIIEKAPITSESLVADIGAGTGIFTKLLIDRGVQVVAVEPNAAMREAAERVLGQEPYYRSAAGAAEETGLDDQAVDAVVCAQAFHWFDQARTQQEFHRILKPGGQAFLIWNARKTSGTPFLEQYEQLLRRYGTDYEKVRHTNIAREALLAFFREGTMKEARFAIDQPCDFDALSGRLRSSSYSPPPGHPNYEPMMAELRRLFDRCEQGGKVVIAYETEIYYGEV